jgi:S1-C subfamily serine protease
MSGLRGGDVVLRADSIKVDTPIDLVRAIRAARPDNTVSLQIIRKRKPQTLVLRW